MKTLRQLALAAALPAMLAAPGTAMPKLEEPRPLGRLTVYADDQRPGLFFYGPGELAMATDRDGKPDFHFLQMRYTGTAVRADRGAIVHRSVLSFRVAMQGPTAAELASARRALGPRPVELRPLPIRRVEAAVVYTPVGEPVEKATALPEGHFEETEDKPPAPAGATANAFWTTRSYALGLDPRSSELFSTALAKGQLVLSMTYSFHTKGAERDHLVRSGAFSISLDTGKWPGLLRRVDVNERVPPGYPLLDIYCYDFQAPQPALYEKQVQVEAEGVAGGRVTATARFGLDQPDLYARSLRFGVAVRLDRPYRYRVTEVRDDGTSAVTPWRERASWAELLDVTTPAVPAEGREPRPGEDP